MKYNRYKVDWSRRDHYIRYRHSVEPTWAVEAINDPDAYWRDPDPASRSGASVRVIGYSPTATTTLTVILVRADADPADRPDGDWWGGRTLGAPTTATAVSIEGVPMNGINELLANEGEAAEGAPTPADGTRANRNRSVVFSVRLNPDELDALQQQADDQGLPARTLARAWIVQRLREEARSNESLRQRVARLEEAILTRDRPTG